MQDKPWGNFKEKENDRRAGTREFGVEVSDEVVRGGQESEPSCIEGLTKGIREKRDLETLMDRRREDLN